MSFKSKVYLLINCLYSNFFTTIHLIINFLYLIDLIYLKLFYFYSKDHLFRHFTYLFFNLYFKVSSYFNHLIFISFIVNHLNFYYFINIRYFQNSINLRHLDNFYLYFIAY